MNRRERRRAGEAMSKHDIAVGLIGNHQLALIADTRKQGAP
jgi:hypothetical protein